MTLDTQELCGKLDQSRGYNMNSISGKPVWPASPRAEDIRIEDIAGALSRICRYNGHLRDYCITEPDADGYFDQLPLEIYSVAQHSVLVEQYVAKWCGEDADSEPCILLRLAALLHDAHEYVLGDMVKPQKLMYKERKRYEMEWDDRIAERFGFSADLLDHPAIKEADYRIFLTEKRDLVVNWTTDFGVAKADPYPERIVPVLPSAARKMFMDRFNELYKGD